MSKSHASQIQQHQLSLPSVLPHAAWMWKPRSKKSIEETLGGVAASFLGVRKVGAQQWKRRYVFFENNVIYYGKGMGKKDKMIPMETIRAANYATRDTLISAKAPGVYIDFGWFMYIEDRELLFCCENIAARKEWVTFVLTVLRLMSGLARPNSQLINGVEGHRTHSLVAKSLDQGQEYRVPDGKASSIIPSPGNGSGAFSRSPLGEATVSEALQLRSSSQGERPYSHSLSSGYEEERSTAFIEGTSTHPKRNSDGEDTLDDSNMSELNDDEGVIPESISLGDEKVAHSPKVDPFDGILLSIAHQRHSHIEYKLDSLKEHFETGDGRENVVFSRSVEKIGKKDNVQGRDLILTSQYFYLVSKSRLTGGIVTCCISTDNIVGVIQSTTEENLMAILIPSFHDILIRFHSHNSRVGGDEKEVKFQFIAHLYKIHSELHLSSRFVMREVENVRAVIRRSEKDKYLPFVSFSGDRMQVGTNKALFPIFRSNAESVVYWSSMVTCIEPDGQTRLRAFVVTDGAFYIVKSTLLKVNRRTSLLYIVKIMYDRDSQTILMRGSEVDTLFTVQSSDEFSRLIVLLPKVVLESCNVRIDAMESKQLYAQAKLLDAKDEQQCEGASRRTKAKCHMLSDVTHPGWFRAYLNRIQNGDGNSTASDNGEDSQANNPGSRAFLAQFRFVEEVYIEFEDEAKILACAKDTQPDTCGLRQSFSTDFDAGQIVYSSTCNKVDLNSLPSFVLLSDKLVEYSVVCRVACVSTRGLMLLHYADDIAKLRQSFKNLLHGSKTTHSRANAVLAKSFVANDPRVDVFIPWEDVVGIIRCHSFQGTVVGIMTGSEHSNDYMLDMGCDEQVRLLISVAANCYIQHNNSPPCAYAMLPLYKVPHTENVRNALKKTVFDPTPTIALQRPPGMYTSDELCMTVVPEIAEACRRFGDNTIYFSGMAWRPQASTFKEKDSIGFSEDETHKKRNRKLFIIVLTNCAIYCCAKGGFEIVRRTELLSIREVLIGRGYPNTLLLRVPTECDLLFHIDGRGKEFLSRLQEAYTLWTDRDLYLPQESPHPHTLSKHPLLVTFVPHLASVTRLEKSPRSDKQHTTCTASEAKAHMKLMHCHHLTFAIARYESVLESAAQGGQKWSSLYECLRASHAMLACSHHRAYSFSIRHDSCEEMRRAQSLLYQFDQMASLVNDMLCAIATEDLALYERAAQSARMIDALRPFLEEHRATHEALRQRRAAIDAIASFLDSASRPPLQDAASELDALFCRAMATGVVAPSLVELRRRADALAQREGLAARLSAPAAAAPPPAVRELIAEAARQLSVPVSAVDAAFSRAASDWRSAAAAAAADAIGAATDAGDAPLLRDVIAHAQTQLCELQANDAQRGARPLQESDATRLRERIAWGKEQLDAYAAHEDARRAADKLVARVARERLQRDWSADDVAARRSQCEAALLRLPAAVPVLARDRRVLALHLRMLAAEAHRLAQVESHARQERMELAHHERERMERQSAPKQSESSAAEDFCRRGSDSATARLRHKKGVDAGVVNGLGGREAAGGGEVRHKRMAGVTAGLSAPSHAVVSKASAVLSGDVKPDSEDCVPAEMLDMISNNRGEDLVAFVRAREGQLPSNVLAKARELWAAARARREWVRQVHRTVHAAFALRNAALLQSQIDAARAAGHSDDVMDGAVEVLAAMKSNATSLDSGEFKGALLPSASNSENTGNESDKSVKDGDTVPGSLKLSRRYDPHAPNALDALLGKLHTTTCQLIQHPRDAQRLSAVAQLWVAVLEHRLRPRGGVLRRVPRDCFGLFRFAASFNEKGDCAAPYTNRMLGDFERMKKLNAPTTISSSRMLVAYMFQCKAMERVIYEITQIERKALDEVFYVNALLNQSQYIGDLLLLARMGEHGDWSAATEKSSGPIPVNANEGTKWTSAGKLELKGTRQVLLRHCREMTRVAVNALAAYFAKQLAVLGVQPSSKKVRGLFDENAYGEVGLIVHEHLLPALTCIMGAGFRSTYQFVRTRHVWEALVQFAEGLQEGSRDLSSVAVTGALLLVTAVTDREGRNRTSLSRFSEDELQEMRLRMFLIECLNRNVLAGFFQLFFQFEEGTAQWTGSDGLCKFYDPQLSVYGPANDKEAAELMEIVEMISKLSFVLVVDRELR